MQTAEVTRNWIGGMCSSLLKLYHGYPTNGKNKDMWSILPENWPPGELFYDPHNTKNKGKDDDNKLLEVLLQCIRRKGISMNDFMTKEIEAWRKKEKRQLVQLFIGRQAVSQIETQLHILVNYSTPETLRSSTKMFSWTINSQAFNKIKPIKKTYLSEVLRDVACILCKIYHEKDPAVKVDYIWKAPPLEWPVDVPFENPYNRRSHSNRWDNERLAKSLLNCCIKRGINIPAIYQEMCNALKLCDYDKLTSSVAICKSVTKIQQSFLKLEKYSLLQDENIRQQLSDIGLLITIPDDCFTSSALPYITESRNIQNCKRKVEKLDQTQETQQQLEADRKRSKPTYKTESDTKIQTNSISPVSVIWTDAKTSLHNWLVYSSSNLETKTVLSYSDTSRDLGDLLNSVDFSRKFPINKHFTKSFCEHLYS